MPARACQCHESSPCRIRHNRRIRSKKWVSARKRLKKDSLPNPHDPAEGRTRLPSSVRQRGVPVNGDRAVHVRQQTLGPRSQPWVLSSDNRAIKPNQVGAEVDPIAVRGETCGRVVATPREVLSIQPRVLRFSVETRVRQAPTKCPGGDIDGHKGLPRLNGFVGDGRLSSDG